MTRRLERRHSRIAWATSFLLHGAILGFAVLAGAVTEVAFLDSRAGNVWIDSASSASMAAPEIPGDFHASLEAVELSPHVEHRLELFPADLPTLARLEVKPPPAQPPQRPRAYETTLPSLEVLLPSEKLPTDDEPTDESPPDEGQGEGQVADEPELNALPNDEGDRSQSPSPATDSPKESQGQGESKEALRPASQGSMGSATLIPGLQTESVAEFSGNHPPNYPAEAISERLSGTVMLRLHVSAEGRVDRVEIVRSSGHAVLDRAAVEAIGRWRAKPARRLGQPVACTTLLPVQFELQ